MGATMGGLLLALAPPLSSGYSLHALNSLSRSCSRARPAHACAAATGVEAPPPSAPSEALVSSAILPMQPGPAQVNPPGCPNCESEWLSRSKETEAAEQIRLSEIRTSDHNKYLNEIYEYAQHMNDTQRQELALKPDTELRKFMIDCSTAPSPLMETVYNATMERVPYEQEKEMQRMGPFSPTCRTPFLPYPRIEFAPKRAKERTSSAILRTVRFEGPSREGQQLAAALVL